MIEFRVANFLGKRDYLGFVGDFSVESKFRGLRLELGGERFGRGMRS